MTESAGIDTASALAALRARGAAQADPVRWHFIEALARRAATKDGELRQRLDARLAELLQAAVATATSAPVVVAVADPGSAIGPAATAAGGPLAALVRLLNPAAAASPTGDRSAPPAGDRALPEAPAELRTLQQHRRRWAQLRIDRQLTGAQAQMPEQAGPLHSDRLVLRALQQMRDLSPGYLAHFAAHVETLLWLEQTAATAATSPGKPAGKSAIKDNTRQRQPGRGKAG